MAKLNEIHFAILELLLILFSACNSNNPQTFQQRISVKSDTIHINNSKDTLIFGSKGTVLFIEKKTFQLPDGTAPKGNISILLKECYNTSDIIRENLTTTANGRLLETKGMVNITAFSNGRELMLKKGKKFIIHFPKNSPEGKKPMNLFYGNSNANGTIDWKLDSVTLLKPTAYMTGWMTTGYPGGDTSQNDQGFYFKGQKNDSIFKYFYKHFDNTKLKSLKDDPTYKLYEANFVVTNQGKIIKLKITAEVYDKLGRKISSKSDVDPYFYNYIQQIPALEPFYKYDENGKLNPADADAGFSFSLGLYPPDYEDNKSYNKIFNQKYSAFKKSAITSMNDAELNYYIFSSTKLGWINCDFLWQVPNEKIDYYVKADTRQNSDVKIIFKQAKSILRGISEGDKVVFKNVPIDQEIKIVAIRFEGNKPLMALTETKTGKQIFDKLTYKPFTLNDLDKEVNSP